MKKMYFTVLLILQALFYLNAQVLEIEVSADKTDVLTCEAINYTLKYKCPSTTTNSVGATMTASVTSGVVFSSNKKLELPSDIASYSISSDKHTITFIFKESLIAGKSGIVKLTGKAECEKPEGTIATLTGTILSGGIPNSTAKVRTTLHADKNYLPKIDSKHGFAIDEYLSKVSNQSFNTEHKKESTSAINAANAKAKSAPAIVNSSNANSKNNAEARAAATCVTILNSSTDNSTVTSCDCIFLDSGDSTANYGTNENYTIHFCSDDPTKKVKLDFSQFGTEHYYDILTIYDGSDDTYNLIGEYSGTNSPGVVISTGSCLTLTWYCDGSGQDVGYKAKVSCVTAGTIGNHVWFDYNKDGIANDGSGSGFNTVYVELYKETTPGNYVFQAGRYTDDNLGNIGYYIFPIETSGNYKIRFAPPGSGIGGAFTTQTPTAATDLNSDADPVTGFSPVIAIDINGTGVAKDNMTIDAGYIETCDNTSYAESITINSTNNNKTFTVNSGYIYSSGSSYGNNENYTVTIQSPLATGRVNINLASLNILAGDLLTIYDGPTATGTPIASISGTSYSPLNVLSTGSTMTLKFTSDGSGTGSYKFEYTTGDLLINTCWGWSMLLNSTYMQPNTAVVVSDNGIIASGNVPMCIAYFDENLNIVTKEISFCLNAHLAAAGVGSGRSYGLLTFQRDTLAPVDMTPLDIARITWIFANAASLGYDINNISDAGEIQQSIWAILGQSTVYAKTLAAYAIAAIPTEPVQPLLTLTGCNTVSVGGEIMYTLTTNSTSPLTLEVSDNGALPTLCGTYPSGTSISGDQLTIGGTGTRTVQLCLTRNTATEVTLIANDTTAYLSSSIEFYIPCDPNIQRFIGATTPRYVNGTSCGKWSASTCTAPTVTCNSVNNSNCATPNGSATATATGVTYLWSNGATTATISNLSAGTYTVTVTSTTSTCTATCSTTVTNTAGSPSLTCSKIDNTNCVTPNGSATANATGVTFLWSNGGTTATISNLSAGTYTVTVTSTTTSCTATCSSVVAATSLTPPNVSCNKVDNTSCVTPNGSATANATGVTFLWSNGGTTATINNLGAGTYTVTVTSTTSGCTATCSTTVATTGTPPNVTCAPTQPTCLSPASGSVAANASGGVGTLRYAWSNGGSSSSISGLGAGTYTVTVSDQNNCTSTCSSVLNVPNGCCSITSITATVGSCDMETNTYTLGGSIMFSSFPSTGTFTLTVGPEGVNKVFNAPFTSPLTYSISGLDSDGTTHTVTGVFSADPTCNISTSLIAPSNCFVPVDECFTSSITAQAGTCDPATNFYSLTGQITFGSTVPTNSITVSVSGGSTVTLNPPFTNPQSYTINNLYSDGLTHVVTMNMNTIGNCTNSASYDAPVVCNCPLTPYSICPGESYTLIAESGYSNYQWYTVSGGTYTLINGANSATYTVTTTGVYTWKATNSQTCPVDACCEYEFIEGNCCTISAELTTPQCMNNSTAITSDDMFGFYVNVKRTGASSSTGWTASNGYSGKYNTNIAIGPLPISGSANPLIITISDSVISTCTTTIQVTPPAPCSSCPTGDCINIKATKN